MNRYKIIFKNYDRTHGEFNNFIGFIINEKGNFINIYWNYGNKRLYQTLYIDQYKEIEIYLDDTRIYYFKDGKEINV